MQPLLLITLVLILVVVVVAIAADPYLARVVSVLTAIALVMFIVAAARYLGWL